MISIALTERLFSDTNQIVVIVVYFFATRTRECQPSPPEFPYLAIATVTWISVSRGFLSSFRDFHTGDKPYLREVSKKIWASDNQDFMETQMNIKLHRTCTSTDMLGENIPPDSIKKHTQDPTSDHMQDLM
ncbi:unnamed protein product [Trichogramma brassicae]|uniref:Uncharacterized protein n=1 Tax=Trichogramma brassicae TaxID=86971 RepID=A0A6H5J0U0_9HYME|nr:unnamed protein product [Trichogramma brassicae]